MGGGGGRGGGGRVILFTSPLNYRSFQVCGCRCMYQKDVYIYICIHMVSSHFPKGTIFYRSDYMYMYSMYIYIYIYIHIHACEIRDEGSSPRLV